MNFCPVYGEIHMRAFRIVLVLLVFSVLFGCATGSYIITGKVRPAIDPSKVKIYLEAPSQYETIGIVEASSEVEFSTQSAQDRAVKELKAQAAKIGANGVLLLNTGNRTGDAVGIISGGLLLTAASDVKTVRGKAIFVTQE